MEWIHNKCCRNRLRRALDKINLLNNNINNKVNKEIALPSKFFPHKHQASKGANKSHWSPKKRHHHHRHK